MRVSRKRLESLVSRVVALEGRPVEWWTGKDSRRGSNPGALRLDHAPIYGGWDLVECVNDKGGEDSLIGNTFAGRGRLSAHEMETFLLGMLRVLEYHPRGKAE